MMLDKEDNMRLVILATLIGLIAFPAMGSPHLGNTIDLSRKGLGAEPAYDGREGGETIEDAVVITTFPYSDTGATCDNVNDYDEVCPYTGSTAPDVVYVFTCPNDDCLTVDLCDAMYDTKTYVYDFEAGYGFGNPWACSDDAGCGYSGYQSLIDAVDVFAGHTYYIVVDGYGSSCGEYYLVVDLWCPECPVWCPEDGVPEGEPPLEDDYVDTWNGGCNSPPSYPFQQLCGNDDRELVLCCNAGNYSYQGSAYRDTDWFIVYKASDPFDVEAEAEYPTAILQLGFDPVQRCDGEITVDQSLLLEPCVPGTMSLIGSVGDEVWVGCGTIGWEDYPEYMYVLSFRGIGGAHTASPKTTWGSVKTLFR